MVYFGFGDKTSGIKQRESTDDIFLFICLCQDKKANSGCDSDSAWRDLA